MLEASGKPPKLRRHFLARSQRLSEIEIVGQMKRGRVKFQDGRVPSGRSVPSGALLGLPGRFP